ncbi:unnamed protein product [Protopolystoma xenopodis]|uniref:Uncharacterized protein n=1 Tax=Protopolystoma xenopodis TaxID=117903 RepID=A0A3S5BXD9_9PLAT|nr:unnamed protein product [Protopolystoma xenopodis]
MLGDDSLVQYASEKWQIVSLSQRDNESNEPELESWTIWYIWAYYFASHFLLIAAERLQPVKFLSFLELFQYILTELLFPPSSPQPPRPHLVFSDTYQRKIAEQEALGHRLKGEQKWLLENQAAGLRQVRLWTDLIRLLDTRMACRERDRQREKAGGEYADVAAMEQDRLLL